MIIKHCWRCEKDTERYKDGKCIPCTSARYASNRDAILARQKERYATDPEFRSRVSTYGKAHNALPEVRARDVERNKSSERRSWRAAYGDKPINRARHFLGANTDCTSTLEEVEAAYSSEAHVLSGKPGKIGRSADDLVMGHIHGGPIVGLIYNWENTALSERVLENWGAFERVGLLHMRSREGL